MLKCPKRINFMSLDLVENQVNMIEKRFKYFAL